MESGQKWFIRTVLKEVFTISLFAWLIMFLMEVLKFGIVSNYISLPRFAILLSVIGVIYLALEPPRSPEVDEVKMGKNLYIILVLLSVISALVIFSISGVFSVLTLLLLSVTFFLIWGGSYMYIR